MRKTLFTIEHNLETGERRLMETDFREFDWTKNEYTAELLNTLAIAIGAKVGSTLKFPVARETLLENLYTVMKEVCFSMEVQE